MERNTSSAVSSPPNKVCICTDDFPQRHTCSHFMQLDTYPGQRFQVPLVCVGQYNYSSPCKVQAHLEITSIGSIDDETNLQNIALECITYITWTESKHGDEKSPHSIPQLGYLDNETGPLAMRVGGDDEKCFNALCW